MGSVSFHLKYFHELSSTSLVIWWFYVVSCAIIRFAVNLSFIAQ